MSRLALDYLERTFKVGRPLESIERDMSNGYVFAVVLAQLGFLSPEEIEEGVVDALGPELVLKNFGVVARGLRKAEIHLTRQVVASIASEQAGAAANLVMQIKRRASGGQSSSAAGLLKYKESIRTLRPKEFVREQDKFSQLSPSDKYHFDAKNVLDSGVFAAIDMRTLLGPRYETFRHATDADFLRQDEQKERARLALRSVKHDATATQRTEFRKSNQATADRITTSWEMSLETKRQRQIRDLQFELVTSKIAQLKGQQRNRLHDEDQITGIDAFETNLKRNGLGGDDTDSGANLTISYEDADAFIDRLETVAKKKWPTKEDAGDFMTQLKLRTADKRTTRYEKARRRRKMLLEQTMAVSPLGIVTQVAAQKGNQPEGTVTTKFAEEKADKYAQMLEQGRLAKEAIKEKSEEEIRLWAEKYRMIAAENADETAAAMQEIMRVREERKMQKHTQNEALCRGMVNEFIGDLFDTGNQKQQQQQQQERKDVLKPNLMQTSMEFSHQLADLAHSRLNEFSGPVISLSDVLTLDSWPASATLAANIAKWTLSSFAAANADIDSPVPGRESHGIEGEGEPVEGEGEPRKESDEAEATEPNLVLIPKSTTIAKRCEAFVEVAQGVLDTLLERTAQTAARGVTPDGPNLSSVEPDFGVILGERAEFASHVGKNAASSIMVLSDGSHVPLSTWNRLISWLGHDLAFLWDGVIALETSVKIRPLVEGKTPTVTFAALVGIFLGEHIVCPAEFASLTLPPSVLRICTELVDISMRIMSIQPQIEDGGAVPAMPFNDISLAALIGQSLWLRNFLADKIDNCPRLAVVGKRFGGGVSVADSVIFARLLEWFLRGGTRDNIPPTDVKMQDALQSEADKASGAGGAGKKKAPPPAKGKGVENAIAEQCSVCAAVWIRLREPKTAACQQDLQNEGEQSISDRIFDAFASSTWIETPAFSLDKEELELLEFAKMTSRGADGSPLRPLSVYCLQYKPQQMQGETLPPQVEEEGNPLDQGEIEFTNFPAQEVVSKHPIDVGINFTSEISISEAIVAIALLEGGVLLGTSCSDGEAEATDESEKTMQEVIARTLHRVLRILHVRRGRLSAPEHVFYLHLTGENVLSMPEAFAAHSLVCEVQALEQELYGLCLLAVERSMLAMNHRMRQREAALNSQLKTGDARWQGLCQATLQQILPFFNNGDAKKIKLALGDLICRLGDVVDERHMAWMQRLDQYEQEAADDVSELKNLLLHMSELLCSCTFRILEAKREAALSLAALLLSAAFTEFPWNLPRQTEAGPRMLLDRCRDDLRASALLLSHACGVQPPEEGDAVASWRDLAAVELPQSLKDGESLSSAALTEVYFESLSVSTALLSATLRGLNSCMQGSSGASRRMHDSVRRRHEYEHSNLADWARKLDEPQFLAQSFFTCSDDVAHDGVEALVGKNVCEARDMIISLAQVHAFAAALSEEFYSAKHQQQVTPTDDDLDPPRSQRDLAVYLAVGAAGKIGKHDLTLSRGWRSPERIESFIREKLDAAPVGGLWGPGGLDEPDSLVLFFRGLISFLVLSAVPEPPSGEALVRLAKSLSFATEDRLTASVLFQKVSSDPKLSVLADAVGAVAYCCLDCDGRVIVEDLLLTLCRSPQRLEKNLFGKCLLLQRGEGPTAELNADADATDLLPCILQDGVSKALRIAASIKHIEGEGQTDFDAKTELSPSSGASHLRTCGGFTVRQRDAQWLSDQLKLNPPLQKNAGKVLSFIGPEEMLDSEIPPSEWIPVVIGDDTASSIFMSSNLMKLNSSFDIY